MTLRARIAAVAGLAVAMAVIVVAVSLYVVIRSELRREVDKSLTERAAALAGPPPQPIGEPGLPDGSPQNGAHSVPNNGAGTDADNGTSPSADNGANPSADNEASPNADNGANPNAGNEASPSPDNRANPSAGNGANPSADNAPGGFPRSVQPAPLGEPSGYVEFVSPTGTIHVPGGQGPRSTIPLSAEEMAIARRGTGRALSDKTINGTHLRVLTLGTGARGAVLIARPLTEVDNELSRVLAVLAIVGVAGIAIAAALGALVARAALAPIARFTRRTETLTRGLDLSQRLPDRGRDELARLASSFNATLDALERSVEAQRNLIADAGHELRTPIASLRANIQVLAEAERLAPDDQAGLRADIVSELDELTRLVGDVVELARGAGSAGVAMDVRLDEIVRDAVGRAQRRADLRFEVSLEPTTIRGEADRVDRAVTNLLDNARKWSTEGGLVEVDLRNGVLAVRDHGPGFEESDLPHVFERFYRADRARKLPGSGLGLAIVRQAAEAHRGYVRAENAPSGGARVQVSFGAPVAIASR